MFTYKQIDNIHIIEIEYNENIISHDKYYEMILSCTKYYNKKYKGIINEYKNLLDKKDYKSSLIISDKHRKVIFNLIKKILDYYPILKTLDFGIFISNSFARGSNLLDSDIDINFVYEDKDICFQIEEQISYAISLIMNKERDFVHDSITHRSKLFESLYTYNENEKVLINCNWSNCVDSYYITKGHEKLMLNYYFGKRDINSYIKFFSYYVNLEEFNEWVYYQKIIYNKKHVNNIFKSIIKKEKYLKKIDINRVSAISKKLIVDFENELALFNKIDFNNMQNFKKYFKNVTYNKIFTCISLLKINEKINFNSVKKFIDKSTYQDYNNEVLEYFSNIMLFNYICDLYGIEFRTRYSNDIPDNFNDYYCKLLKEDVNFIIKFQILAENIYSKTIEILKSFVNENNNKFTFNIYNEYINIENYSPFSMINEVSLEYQKKSFLLPFIRYNGKLVPIHPDTFKDLNLSLKQVVKEELVFPTSSFRTVYNPKKNICYKLPLLRKITRSIRSLHNKELERSLIAQKLLKKYKLNGFTVLKEICYFSQDENYNYIIRKMPECETYPWFYIIASQKFSKEFQIQCLKNIISSWMFFASKGIYFESPHTQNYLIDINCNLYYRDLSDIRNLDYDVMRPSFYKDLENDGEMLSIFFDRAICNQTINHLVKYCKSFNDDDEKDIKTFIKNEIVKYKLPFPNYSMDYSKSKPGHVPEKVELVKYRK